VGKTKTFIVEGVTEDQKSGAEAYAEKMQRKAEIEAAKTRDLESQKPDKNEQKTKKPSKDQVKGVGLKGGERIKVIGAQIPEEPVAAAVTEADSAPKKEKKAKVRSKNYKSAYSKFNKEKLYKLPDALGILREVSYSKFDPTVELHISVKTSPLSVNTALPHSAGKEKKVEVASEKTIENLKSGKVNFDILLATADMMPKLVPFARILGPKGLMPNPKNGTLIKSAKEADKFGGNSINLKTQKDSTAIHTIIGKLSLKDKELSENAKAIFDAIGEKQIVKIFLKSTMSPSIKVQV